MKLQVALGAELAKLLPLDDDRRLLVPFGSVPKSVLDAAVFDGLVAAGLIDPSASAYQMALVLGVTPARARSLVMGHRLRALRGEDASFPGLGKLVLVDLPATVRDETDIHFVVEDLFAREFLIDRLREEGVLTDSSFSPQRVKADRSNVIERWSAIFDSEIDAADAKERLKKINKALRDEQNKSDAKKALEKVTEVGTAFAANFAATLVQLSR